MIWAGICAVDLTICIRFGKNVTPKEIYDSISFGRDPEKLLPWQPFLLLYLGSWTWLPQAGPFHRF